MKMSYDNENNNDRDTCDGCGGTGTITDSVETNQDEYVDVEKECSMCGGTGYAR